MMMKWLLSPWIAVLVLQALLTGVLLTKRMWRKFPFFFLYSVSNFVVTVVLFTFLAFQLPQSVFYFYVFWINEGAGLILGLAVVYEIFKHLFTPYPALRRLATLSFRAAIVLLILLGFIVAYAQPLAERKPIMAAFLVVDQATRILEVGLLVSLFLFASAFGLHWRQYVFGIALGLGIFVAVELVGITLKVQLGVSANPIVNAARTISFNSSLFIWIAYMLAPELVSSPVAIPKRAQLEQWNRAVMELIYQ